MNPKNPKKGLSFDTELDIESTKSRYYSGNEPDVLRNMFKKPSKAIKHTEGERNG